MKKIKFTIENKKLFINYKIENNAIKNINNTNIISDEDLIFDSRYFKNNTTLIANFLNVIIKNEDVKEAVCLDEDLVILSLNFLNKIPNIEELTIKPNISINYDMHLAILKNDTLKKINVFTIPTYLLERIDTTKNIKIETRNEVFFVSNFLRVNKLNSYSDVYYKKKLVITYEFNEFDWQDFETFLSINLHLKVIYFDYVSMNMIKKICEYLYKNDRHNILISIKAKEENLKQFSEIENFYKKDKAVKKNKFKFNIDYTTEYKIENLFKLLRFTTIKYMFIVVIISALLGYGINQYDLYKSSKQVKNINDDIAEMLEEFIEYDVNPEEVNEEEEIPTEPEEPTPNNPPAAPAKPAYVSPYYKNYSQVISVLKESNSDTVGWLRVNDTTVNYPVVQSTNNSYYLTHDFARNSNSMGWIFMDYRNDPNNLHQNTIIYGHNIYYGQIMFGNLAKTMNASWYKNKQNQIITFNTASKDMKWQIFSIYKVEATNDYLYSVFDTQDEFLAFANKLKSRSIYDFGVELHENDKILTLSTCQNSGKNRLAIHAVLVE